MLLMLAFVSLWAAIEAMAAHVPQHDSPDQVVWTRAAVHLALTPFMPSAWVTPLPHGMLLILGVGVFGCAALCMFDRLAMAAPVSACSRLAYLQIALTVSVAIVAGMGHELAIRHTALGLLFIAGVAFCVQLHEPRLQFRDAVAT
jgi:drug/metabolite transporter (DMT)-like permease